MNELRISGASDDLVEFDGAIREEFDSYDRAWSGTLQAPDGAGLTIGAFYTDSGVWVIGVAPLEEDAAFPGWPMRFEKPAQGEASYSSVLVIDVPEGATIKAHRDPKN